MDELKQPALEALRERRIVYHPESQHRFAIDSLENAPDWNISRQIWWGHQIPVWYCPDGHVTVEETEPAACAECGSAELTRETDVLDTWFSSALWPFATLGWPDETPGPAHVLSRRPADDGARDHPPLGEPDDLRGPRADGRDPVQRRGHPLDRARPDGRRMSKSLGTGIDPLEMIERYGTDATRYGLMKNSLTQDVRFSYSAIEEGRKLANKLWNAARLIITAAEGAAPAERPRRSRSAGSSRGSRRRSARSSAFAEFDFAHARRRALPPHVRRLLRLVPRGDQAAPLRRRRGRARDRDRRARAAAEAAAPGDAARDRGDLVEPAAGRRG